MTATIHEIADYEGKHRRAPSSLPPLIFPGNDVITDPAPMGSLVSSARSSGFTPEELEECGFRWLPAAMRSRRFRPHLKAVPA